MTRSRSLVILSLFVQRKKSKESCPVKQSGPSLFHHQGKKMIRGGLACFLDFACGHSAFPFSAVLVACFLIFPSPSSVPQWVKLIGCLTLYLPHDATGLLFQLSFILISFFCR